jgi:hypothetical protein
MKKKKGRGEEGTGEEGINRLRKEWDNNNNSNNNNTTDSVSCVLS